jgi:hypothetical protein
MSGTEQRLRDALRSTAETVDESRPRPLPAVAERRRWALPAPLLAVASVLVVMALSLTVAAQLREGDRGPQGPVPAPRFYVTTVPAGDYDSLVEVRESATGELSASYRSSGSERFLSVAAAKDRTFFVLSQEDGNPKSCRPLRVYRMSVDVDGKIMSFDVMAGISPDDPVVLGTAAFAVSPDGRRFAFGARKCRAGNEVVTAERLADGSTSYRKWQEPGADSVIGGLSWSADGRSLAMFRRVGSAAGTVRSTGGGSGPPRGHGEVRLLSPVGDGDLALGRPVLEESAALPHLAGAVISPDGQRLIAVASGGNGDSAPGGGLAVVETSIADGRILRDLYEPPESTREPSSASATFTLDRPIALKRDASGDHLLLSAGGLVHIQGAEGRALPPIRQGGDFAW